MKQSEAVRELRHRLNLTQQELAVQAGLAVRTISVYETGNTPGSYEVTVRFAKIAEQHGFLDLLPSFLPMPAIYGKQMPLHDLATIHSGLTAIRTLGAELPHPSPIRTTEETARVIGEIVSALLQVLEPYTKFGPEAALFNTDLTGKWVSEVPSPSSSSGSTVRKAIETELIKGFLSGRSTERSQSIPSSLPVTKRKKKPKRD